MGVLSVWQAVRFLVADPSGSWCAPDEPPTRTSMRSNFNLLCLKYCALVNVSFMGVVDKYRSITHNYCHAQMTDMATLWAYK